MEPTSKFLYEISILEEIDISTLTKFIKQAMELDKNLKI